MLKSIISVIAISLLLWGCAAPTYFKDSSWTEQPTSVKVVYVDPTISNPKQLTDGLPEYKDNLGKWFENVVTEKMDEESRKKSQDIHRTCGCKRFVRSGCKTGGKGF